MPPCLCRYLFTFTAPQDEAKAILILDLRDVGLKHCMGETFELWRCVAQGKTPVLAGSERPSADASGRLTAECARLLRGRTMIRISQDHYPERCEACYCLNPPAMFSFMFRLARAFVNPATLKKVRMVPQHQATPAQFAPPSLSLCLS